MAKENPKDAGSKPKEPRMAIYIGTKTAFYNDRSYFPGEVFPIPDEIPDRDEHGEPKFDDEGKPIMRPLVLTSRSKIRLATPEEIAAAKEDPRAKRRAVGANAPLSRGAFGKSTSRPGTEPRFA